MRRKWKSADNMAQNTRKPSNLVDVIRQIHSAADADCRRKMAAGIEITSVEAKLPCTEELLAAILELQDISDDFPRTARKALSSAWSLRVFHERAADCQGKSKSFRRSRPSRS
jgi:hypothetical protein